MALTSNKRPEPTKIQEPKVVPYESFAREPQNFNNNNANSSRTNDFPQNTSKPMINPFETYASNMNNSHSSSFSKKPGEFDIFKEKKAEDKEKFNIFGNENPRFEPKSTSKLNIDDSQ